MKTFQITLSHLTEPTNPGDPALVFSKEEATRQSGYEVEGYIRECFPDLPFPIPEEFLLFNEADEIVGFHFDATEDSPAVMVNIVEVEDSPDVLMMATNLFRKPQN